MGKTLITTQQARGTLWESEVMGGENQESLKTPSNLEGRWETRVSGGENHQKKKHPKIRKLGGFALSPPFKWGLCPHTPLFLILLF